MDLIVFGGIHNNPLHRRRLKRWLECLHDRLVDPPAFLAVEANRVLFQAVIRHQRSRFVNQAKKDKLLCRLPSRLLENLSRAIAYEADTHEELGCFAEDLPLVWLDDVLQDQDLKTVNDPCGEAKRHLRRCQEALTEAKTPDRYLERETPVFNVIDAYLRRDAEQPHQRTDIDRIRVPGLKLPGPFDRDDRWVELLRQRFDLDGSGFGIIIVGENHTRRDGRYLVKQIEDIGCPCQVHLLKNEESPTTSFSGS